MAQLLQIAQLGQKVLRQKAKSVTDVKSGTVQKLIDDLLATLKEANGVGIATPQVYVSQRIFIVASYPNPRYPNAPKMRPLPVINPKIIYKSKDTAKDWEGCLSIPGIRASVSRSKQIKVEFTTRKGKLVKRSFKEFIARIFQHEYDHLEGIMFLDRLESNKDMISEKEYQRLMASKTKKAKS